MKALSGPTTSANFVEAFFAPFVEFPRFWPTNSNFTNRSNLKRVLHPRFSVHNPFTTSPFQRSPKFKLYQTIRVSGQIRSNLNLLPSPQVTRRTSQSQRDTYAAAPPRPPLNSNFTRSNLKRTPHLRFSLRNSFSMSILQPSPQFKLYQTFYSLVKFGPAQNCPGQSSCARLQSQRGAQRLVEFPSLGPELNMSKV
jgi:hypothetical protein